MPVSLEVSLVAHERHWSIVTTESLIFTDDVQISGRVDETCSTDDRIDDNKRTRPLEIPLGLFVCLDTQGDAEYHSDVGAI